MHYLLDTKRVKTNNVLTTLIVKVETLFSVLFFICAHEHDQAASFIDVQTSVSTAESTESLVTDGAVSVQQAASAEEHTIDNASSIQSIQTRVESEHRSLNEYTLKDNNVYKSGMHATAVTIPFCSRPPSLWPQPKSSTS